MTTILSDKLPRRKKEISETRNVEAPKCRSLLPNAGDNYTPRSNTTGVVSVDNTEAIGFWGFDCESDDCLCRLEEDDFNSFEDLEMEMG